MPVTHLIHAFDNGLCNHRDVIADDDLHAHAHAPKTIADVDAIWFGSGTYRLLHWSRAAEEGSGSEVTKEFREGIRGQTENTVLCHREAVARLEHDRGCHRPSCLRG